MRKYTTVFTDMVHYRCNIILHDCTTHFLVSVISMSRTMPQDLKK